MHQNEFSKFGRGSPKKHTCGIILKSGIRSTRIFHLKIVSIFISGGPFVQRSETILAIYVKGSTRNISMKLFLN